MTQNMDARPARNPSWWKRRSMLERRLVVSVIVAVILAFSLAVVVITKSKNSSDYQIIRTEKLSSVRPETPTNSHCPNSEELCLTRGCIKSVTEVLDHLDESVEPCDDFYKFACGTYLNTVQVPEDKTNVNSFSVISDQVHEQVRTILEEPILPWDIRSIEVVKSFYQACMNTTATEVQGLKGVKDLLTTLGGWPVVEGRYWNHSAFDWRQSLYKHRENGLSISSIIEFAVGMDLLNSSKRIIQLDQPNLGLNREYLIKGLNNTLVKAYYKYMVDVAVSLGADKDRAEKELRESLEFEMKLANFSLSKEERRNITSLNNAMTINELAVKFPIIPWLGFINKMLPGNMTVTFDEVVLLAVPKYVAGFESIINTTPKRVQANYIMWRMLKKIATYLNEEIRTHQLNYFKEIAGLTKRPPKWKECADEASDNLPMLVGALYVRRYFKEDAKKNALEIVNYIQREFRHILETIDWMDDETRVHALGKADTIVNHIGYPDELLDNRKLDDIHDELDVYADRYLQTVLNVNKFQTDFQYKRLREVVNKTDWIDHANPAQVNAYYHPLENSIVFPASILQGILFNKDRPRYMNYGAIGSVIGHEITHGFDDTGKQFDKEGNLVDWWAPVTQKAFLEKAKCIIEQYGNYTVPQVNENLNGINTQGENIADNGGVKEAYLAYNRWVSENGPEPQLPALKYTPKQLFWISAAQNWCAKFRPEALKLQITTDTHSPGEFRVLGPFSNSEDFSQDFQCPVGTKMNPAIKCSVW